MRRTAIAAILLVCLPLGAAADEAVDGERASSEALAEYRRTRDPERLLHAARLLDVAGRREEAVACYWLLYNGTSLAPADRAIVRERLRALRWNEESGPAVDVPPPLEPPREPPPPAVAPAIVVGARPVPADKPETVWYGWQILLIEAGGIALMVVDDDVARVLGATTYLLASPLVHAANGQGKLGAAGIGARAGMTLLGGLYGLAKGGDEASALAGAAVGLLAGEIMDVAGLARKTRARPATAVVPGGATGGLAWIF